MIAASLILLAATPSADDFGARLARFWQPDCSTGQAATNVTAIVRLDRRGYLVGQPLMIDRRVGLAIDPARPDQATAGAVKAAERAKNAIVRGQPFSDIPSDLVGRALTVNFNAQAACS
jgi:hypothetical protein